VTTFTWLAREHQPKGTGRFLDRLNLKTLALNACFAAMQKRYESVIAPLSDDMKVIFTRYETPKDPPNYYVRDLSHDAKRAVTAFKDSTAATAGRRASVCHLSAQGRREAGGHFVLPPGYKKGERLPVIMWAYPREFGDAIQPAR